MRLTIRHETSYRFATPASSVVQTLRLHPRSDDGQHVVRWRVDVDRNCRLRVGEDAFGNRTHVFAAEGPIEALTVSVEGEVDTQDTAGVTRGAIERFPPALYLRETQLTSPDSDIAAAAAEAAAGSSDVLGTLHALMARVHETMAFETDRTDSGTTATEAFRLKRGVCQDFAHVFIVGARSLKIPARYVSGYFRRADGVKQQEAGHAWAEAYVPDLGWVSFDPANDVCGTEAHVRVAIGLDYLAAAPVRGTRYGGSGETLSVSIVVDDVRAQRSHRRS